MTLPRVETPTYELTLPSQELKVKYRPFLVKEENAPYNSQVSPLLWLPTEIDT